MADSPFAAGINIGNDAFAKAATEKFSVVKGGNTGEYDAVSIEDVTAGTAVSPGGLRGDPNTVLVFANRSVVTAGAITDGTILVVRGKRVRVVTVADEGDNTLLIQCGSSGIKMQ